VNALLKTTLITFRRLTLDDLPLIHKWLNTPEVAKWYREKGASNPSYEFVSEIWTKMIKEKTPAEPFLIQNCGHPIGYIQRYLISTPEDIDHHHLSADAAGIDLFIGEMEYLHKGLGSIIIRQFLTENIFAVYKVETCIIDPEPDNKIAIRSYEKAGFKHYMTTWNLKDAVASYLMRIERNDICPPFTHQL